MTRFFPCIGLSVATVLCLCASAVADGTEPATSKVFSSPAEAVKGTFEGATVLWGGRIFERETSDGKTCVGVVAFPLNRKDARPNTRAQPGQVFYACSTAALDASDYAAGRQIAVAGKLGPIRERIVGHSCAHLPRTANLSFRGTTVDQAAEGCKARMPVVFIADGHTWADPPDAHPPEFM
jgi:starvation-inducible outer membrane lipoprotein